MSFIADRWRRIGTRLYLVLGFAVLLTLISSAVGVFYFERSGDLNYKVESQSVPALEASWNVAREAERLRSLGIELTAAEAVGTGTAASRAVEDSLALGWRPRWPEPAAAPALEPQVLAVQGCGIRRGRHNRRARGQPRRHAAGPTYRWWPSATRMEAIPGRRRVLRRRPPADGPRPASRRAGASWKSCGTSSWPSPSPASRPR